MATQKGTVGGIFGIPGSTSVAMGGQTFAVVRTYNYSKEADTKEVRNASGDVVNMTYYNARERISLDLIVNGTTLAAALTSFNVLPVVGATVDITSTSGDSQIDSAGDTSDEWTVESASKVATQDDFGTMSITCVRWTNDLDAIS